MIIVCLQNYQLLLFLAFSGFIQTQKGILPRIPKRGILLRMKEFNKKLNGGIAHLKPFPGSKAKQMDNHAIPILEEHQYDAAVMHVGINDLLKSRANINVSEIEKNIVNIALRCQSHNIATVFISSIVYSTKISHTKTQKLNGVLLNECTE